MILVRLNKLRVFFTRMNILNYLAIIEIILGLFYKLKLRERAKIKLMLDSKYIFHNYKILKFKVSKILCK